MLYNSFPGLKKKKYEHRVVQQTYLGKVKKVGIWNVIECKDIYFFNSQGSFDPFDGCSSVKPQNNHLLQGPVESVSRSRDLISQVVLRVPVAINRSCIMWLLKCMSRN